MQDNFWSQLENKNEANVFLWSIELIWKNVLAKLEQVFAEWICLVIKKWRECERARTPRTEKIVVYGIDFSGAADAGKKLLGC